MLGTMIRSTIVSAAKVQLATHLPSEPVVECSFAARSFDTSGFDWPENRSSMSGALRGEQSFVEVPIWPSATESPQTSW